MLTTAEKILQGYSDYVADFFEHQVAGFEEMKFDLHLIKTPAGTWSFVGTVPARLAYVNKDGSELTDTEIKELSQASNPSMLAKVRSFKTEGEAYRMAKKLKIKIK